MADLSHLQPDGTPKMVDVGGKTASLRRAVVGATLRLRPEHVEALRDNPKGNVFVTAQIAGIQAGKACAQLIPLCHTVALTHLDVFLSVDGDAIQVQAVAEAKDVTGVEMEAYIAATVAGLTLIDMLKAASPDLVLTDVRLLEKTGGKSEFHRSEP